MSKFLLLIIPLIFLFESAFSVRITGTAKGFEEKFVRLYAISDFISYREVKLDVVKIDLEGNFELNGHLLEASLIKIKIEDKTLDLIVLPKYSLKIVIEYDKEMNQGRFFDKSLNVDILENSDNGINVLMFEYQKTYAAFLDDNHALLVTKKILPKVFEFQEKMIQLYAQSPVYFKDYLEYNLASLEDAVLGSEEKLFNKHIQSKPIRYDNIGYMKFFTQFYQERFIQISQGKKGFSLLSAVNGTQDYPKMMEILNEHVYVDNDTLAQLFALTGLKEVHNNETFKREKVLSMLTIVKNNALNDENQRIAQNILEELTFLKASKEAPEINLKDEMGEVHHLADMKGQPILVFFWSALSNTCLRDISILMDYQAKYLEKIEIVFVNLDDNPSKALNYLDRNEIPFLQLFKDRQYDLIDKYRVLSVPTYLLINSKGLIAKYPAKRPEENLEADIYRLISEN